MASSVKSLEAGDRVVYTRAFLRSIAAGPTSVAARLVGTVTGRGLTASTWHCAQCGAEVDYAAPGVTERPVNAPPPECHPGSPVNRRDHGPSDLDRFVRLRWDGDSKDTETGADVVCRQYSLPASEEIPFRGPRGW